MLLRFARPSLGLFSTGSMFAIMLLPIACTGTSGGGTESETNGSSSGDGSQGEALYSQPVADGNSFACETCHALSEPSVDGIRRPGHALGDATRRPNWKNGIHVDMREAVNSCLTEWMNAEPWTASDERWIALYDFLDAQAPAGDAPPLSFKIVAPPTQLDGGDADAGQILFNQSCVICHGQDGIGTNQAPPVTGQGQAADYVARRVRTSGRADSSVYTGLTGGVMPFWAADRLSDDELRDLIAYLGILDNATTSTTGETDGTTTGTTDGTTTGTTTGGECPTTSARIGWTATLETKFHGVKGLATIIDDCTVVITDFGYDGTGIDVRIYGAENSDYDNGYAMTDNLLKAGGYEGVTLTATLPEGVSMDNLDGISVWCVDVGVDFGSGVFTP
ncbi:MAG TPA: c-type cytochrome [Nannocystis exedens]|nr:c-type cytochrome [Nannocystis exedens]